MERFFPAARWAITRPGDFRIWAVPLLTDTRVIYYRREQLQEAGIDPEEAFQTTASLMATLKRLQERGVAVPWAMPTRGLDVLYNAASFIWAARGRIRTEDGRHLQLTEPQAQAGLRSFLGLHSFLARPAQGLDAVGTNNLFQEGEVAAALSGPWLLRQLEQDPVLLAGVGVAPVPGVPFIGGSHLVMWRHGRNEREVIKLVQHLTSPETQQRFFQQSGHLPARLEVLAGEPFASDPRYRAFAQSLNTGRVLTVSYRWAAVEQRLVTLLARLWSDVAADPELDLDVEIAGRVAALVDDLEHTLLATW
jgi:multiple sugar transport system substrate-binding protein